LPISQLPIVFAGTSDFAVPSLIALLEAGYEIAGVYTKPDRHAGRGKKLTYSPVKNCAVAHDLNILQPTNFTSEISRLKSLNPEILVVVSYGIILPSEVLNLPNHGCLNIHASLLPRWRGAAPIQRAIESGDSQTGITLMKMAAELDAGDLLVQKMIPICEDDTSGSLHYKLANTGAELLITTLPQILAGTARSRKQDEKYVTYANKINNYERWLDWNESAIELSRKISAFNPKPLARAMLGKQILLVHRTTYGRSNSHELPGTIIDIKKNAIRVQTGNGFLDLLQLQIPGRRTVKVSEFLHGYSVNTGERFQDVVHAKS
tara:strand:- start:71755 stop:72714 length:960 start_codon:yes stop_codon:yes gene_type:complete